MIAPKQRAVKHEIDTQLCMGEIHIKILVTLLYCYCMDITWVLYRSNHAVTLEQTSSFPFPSKDNCTATLEQQSSYFCINGLYQCSNDAMGHHKEFLWVNALKFEINRPININVLVFCTIMTQESYEIIKF